MISQKINNGIFKIINNIIPVKTSHNVGIKRILFAPNNIEDKNVHLTQIANTILNPSDLILEHIHPSMDEHFIILSGHCLIKVNGVEYNCEKGSYLYVPAQSRHSINVYNTTSLITIGVSTNE